MPFHDRRPCLVEELRSRSAPPVNHLPVSPVLGLSSHPSERGHDPELSADGVGLAAGLAIDLSQAKRVGGSHRRLVQLRRIAERHPPAALDRPRGLLLN